MSLLPFQLRTLRGGTTSASYYSTIHADTTLLLFQAAGRFFYFSSCFFFFFFFFFFFLNLLLCDLCRSVRTKGLGGEGQHGHVVTGLLQGDNSAVLGRHEKVRVHTRAHPPPPYQHAPAPPLTSAHAHTHSMVPGNQLCTHQVVDFIVIHWGT